MRKRTAPLIYKRQSERCCCYNSDANSHVTTVSRITLWFKMVFTKQWIWFLFIMNLVISAVIAVGVIFILGVILKPFHSSSTRNCRRTFFNDHFATPHKENIPSTSATYSSPPFYFSSINLSTLTNAPSLCMPDLWKTMSKTILKKLKYSSSQQLSDEITKFELVLQTIRKNQSFCPKLQTCYKPQIA